MVENINKKPKYKIKIDEKHPNLIQKYVEDMKNLSPNADPYKYIALHNKWTNLKDVIAKEHLKVYEHVCEKHPNIVIDFEGRIKSLASTFEKSYMKTEETLEENPNLTAPNPIIYDGVACRMVITSADYKVLQTAQIFDEKTQKFYYAFRTKQNDKVSTFKILPGDCVVLENGNSIEITENNLRYNPDGTLSIRNGDDYLSLTNRTIQKTDAQTLKKLAYEVNETLSNYLISKGYICIPHRKKDFIKKPKFPKLKAKFNEKFNKKHLKSSKRLREKINFLKSKGITLQAAGFSAYQSLHFGAFDPEYKYYFEYQVRSHQMHQIAEHDRFIGHDTYKKLPIDASAPYRVPTTFTFKKFMIDGKPTYESTFYDEDYMYNKIFEKSKSEVLKEIAQMDNSEDLPEGIGEDIEEEPEL